MKHRPDTHRLADLDDCVRLLERAIAEAEDDDQRRHAARAKVSVLRLAMTIRDRIPAVTDGTETRR